MSPSSADGIYLRAQAAIAHAQFETVHRAIAQLVEADVLVETTGAKRNRVWVAKEVTAALDDFGRRIGGRRRSRRREGQPATAIP